MGACKLLGQAKEMMGANLRWTSIQKPYSDWGFFGLFRPRQEGRTPPPLRYTKIIEATTTKLGGYIVRPKMFILTCETRDDDVTLSIKPITISEQPPSWIH